MGDFSVIFPGAGRSSRFGDPKHKKIYAELDGRAVWLRAVEPFVNRDDVKQMILAIAADDREMFERRFRPSVAFMNIQVIEGGEERFETVARALEQVDASCSYVAIHDAARPCLAHGLIDAVFNAARDHGAALPGVPLTDTIKRANKDQHTIETVPRVGLIAVQTPQAFERNLLVRAYANRSKVSQITDDAQLVEAVGHTCKIVEGSSLNLKITTSEDLRLASAVLKVLPKPKLDALHHPFADEKAMWGNVPKMRPEDLF